MKIVVFISKYIYVEFILLICFISTALDIQSLISNRETHLNECSIDIIRDSLDFHFLMNQFIFDLINSDVQSLNVHL